MSTKHCLINVDLQYDFIAGSLALKHAPAGHDAEEIIPTVNRLIQCGRFDLVVYSLDFHPSDHISFVDNAAMYTGENRVFSMGDTISVKTKSHAIVRQQLWPRHCVQGTEGARLWPSLHLTSPAVFVHKGTESVIESYSVFGNRLMDYSTGLDGLLQSLGITHVYLTGVAEDICV